MCSQLFQVSQKEFNEVSNFVQIARPLFLFQISFVTRVFLMQSSVFA